MIWPKVQHLNFYEDTNTTLKYFISCTQDRYVEGINTNKSYKITAMSAYFCLEGAATNFSNCIPATRRREKHEMTFALWCKFSANSPVAKPQIFGEPCNTVRTKLFCCFHTSKVCCLKIWMMPLCHPWAAPPICKLRPPLRKILLSSISQSLCLVSK